MNRNGSGPALKTQPRQAERQGDGTAPVPGTPGRPVEAVVPAPSSAGLVWQIGCAAALFLAGVAAILLLLRERRLRRVSGPSLITRSLDGERK